MAKINIKFPFRDEINVGDYVDMNIDSANAIKSNLIHFLLTEKGERYYYPDFGTNLKRFLFEPNDEQTNQNIIFDINEGTKKYVPGVTINSLKKTVEGTQLVLDILFKFETSTFSFEDFIILRF